MDMPYRTFATRSSRSSERFEQLGHGNRGSGGKGDSSAKTTAPTRKRVNVVTFRPSPSPVDEVGKGSTQISPFELSRSTTTLTPISSSSKSTSAPSREFRAVAMKTPDSEPMISPKFRRRANYRSGPTKSCLQQPLATTNQRSRLAPNQSLAKITPPSPLTSEKSEADPYAWVEEDEEKPEPEPKSSVFAFREEDEEDDGIKPWFWPASRDAVKPTPTTHPHPSHPPSTDRKVGAKGAPPSPLTNGTGVEAKTKNNAAMDKSDLYAADNKVKTSLDSQERGSVQHALDDMNYLIDGLSDANTTDARCLSILSLANKCLTPATRDLVHAYGLLKRICANLHDAHTDYSLCLAAAGLFFVISRDRDPDLLTAESLAVLLQLLHAPSTMTENATLATDSASMPSKYSIGAASRQGRLNKEANQIRCRVQQLLEAVAAHQQKRGRKSSDTATKAVRNSSSGSNSTAAGMAALFVRKNLGVASLFSSSTTVSLNARHLRMNRQLTARDMILEAILNLSTRRAAPWFKAGIRTGGGLDGVADATIDAVDYLKDLCTSDAPGGRSNFFVSTAKNPTGLDEFSLDNLKRVGHYAKMLENMTYMNPDNQTHLVRYKERVLIDRLVQCIRLCASRLPRHAPPSVSWTELLWKESEEKTSGQQEQNQPPTSSTEGVKPAASTEVEFQQDQQTLLTCLLAIFRLFVNVSHSEYASDRLGGCPDLLEATLDCLFHLPDRLPSSRRFDLLILVLCLLANLCEHCPENRIRVVHLEVRSPESSTDGGGSGGANGEGVSLADVGYEDDETEGDSGSPRLATSPRVPTVSALDEVVKLFLYREKKTLMHEFEREEEEVEGREKKTEEADSTTTTTSALQRPKPPPSLLTDSATETIEEAGLKWRLVGGNRHDCGRGGSTDSSMPSAASRSSKSLKRSRMRAKRRRRRQTLLRRGGGEKRARLDGGMSSEDEEEEDEEDEEEEDEDEMCSDEDEGSDGSEEDDEYDEDDELCGGADVEFVAETQEEQEKLKERMSSANQHMEDSVVAAYAGMPIFFVLVLVLFQFCSLHSMAVWFSKRGECVDGWMTFLNDEWKDDKLGGRSECVDE
ncbi:wings apart protein [Echinococcus multilocularis]|uniref:Wings apart protein n=1 Tax=Echinococcus multilocularis TaxID=6211 RepID=A0A087VYM1_ECHMU|nr:wings apart protein [Echinococcus multilocularis]